MHITVDQILSGLSIVLTIVSLLLGSKVISNARLQEILTVVAAAEHLIDASAYQDGKLDEARVDLALQILAKIAPWINQASAKTDIEKFLVIVHDHANSVPAPTQPVIPPPPGSAPKSLLVSGVGTSVAESVKVPPPAGDDNAFAPGKSTEVTPPSI